MTDDDLFTLLNSRKALIVHCSRPGKADEGIDGLLFPDDLHRAIDICANHQKELSCSLIWPEHTKTFGAVGIILSPRSTASIRLICPTDAGTSADPVTGKRTGNGASFSKHAVDDTFANSTDYNEWTVTDADTVGIFVNLAEPLVVAKVVPWENIPGYDASMMGDLDPTVGQVEITLKDVVAAFPGRPVYGFVGPEIVQIGGEAV